MTRWSLDRDDGATMVEVVTGLTIIAILTSLVVPVTAHAIDDGRARHAAGFVAARLRMARQQAAFRSTAVALVFDRAGAAWTFRVCVDQNGNGVRRAEIASGADVCVEGPFDLARMFPGVSVASDAGIAGPDGDAGSADPVRFGSSDMASFSAEGTGSAGTLFLRSRQGAHFAVRIAGITGRTRVLRYEMASRRWLMG